MIARRRRAGHAPGPRRGPLAGLRPRRARVAAAVTLAASLLAPACTAEERFGTPVLHAAPYEHPVRWAVVPLLNESGTSVADPLRIADALQAEVEAIEGVDAIPVDRTIVAMRAEELPRVATAYDAQRLMRALDADGLVVGTITAWSPYRPMTLGLALELHVRESASSHHVDPWAITTSPADDGTNLGTVGPPGPVAAASEVFDAADHRVLKWVREYADARHVPDDGFRRDVYLVSMDRYARFASWRMLGSILGRERLRLAGL